jgi:hypothetical protein
MGFMDASPASRSVVGSVRGHLVRLQRLVEQNAVPVEPL